MSVGDCDPAAGMLASGLPRLCSSGVGVKWTPPLVDKSPTDEGSVLMSSGCRAGPVIASSLGSVEMSLEGRVVGAAAVVGIAEAL